MDKIKSIFREGYDHDDFCQLPFNAAGGQEVSYVIGTNALASDPSLPTTGRSPGMLFNMDTVYDPTTGHERTPLPGFTAQEVILRTTQDCLVRFNEPVRVQHLLLAGDSYRFHRKVYRLYAVGSGVAGTLYIHALG